MERFVYRRGVNNLYAYHVRCVVHEVIVGIAPRVWPTGVNGTRHYFVFGDDDDGDVLDMRRL